MTGSTLRSDDRGEIGGNSMAVITLVVALTVGLLLAAFVMPIGLDSLNDRQTTSLNQSVGETTDVTGGLNQTLDYSNATDSDASVTLQTDDDTASLTNISEGNQKSATLEGYNVTVAVDTAADSYAETTVTYPPEIGYSSGAQALWGILDVILVLAVFLFFVAVAVGASDRV